MNAKTGSGFAVSLSSRLALAYALFISLALGGLAVIINVFVDAFFVALVKDNITQKSEEIVRSIEEQYNPLRGFNIAAVEALGMSFAHEGYIVAVHDERGDLVWGARFCDMHKCREVLQSITELMMERFHINGAMRAQTFPLRHAQRTAGQVISETYGPYFYSRTEARFLAAVNRLLFIAAAVFALFGIGMSLALSRAIAGPIRQAEQAARKLVAAYSAGRGLPAPGIRVDDRYATKELAGLSRSINELAAALEEGERRRKQLTADIAHELRTPLACLQGTVEAVLDGVRQADQAFLQSCHEEVIRLADLVRDLDTLAAFDWKNIALNPSTFDLAKLLRMTAETFQSAALEKGIAITLDVRECAVTADYDRLKQVFINLLANAVQYTDAGGIAISLSKEDQPPRWEVSVADTGIGIAREDLPHIFERFYRSDKSRSRHTGGSGNGLAIAAAIVAAHGGSISVAGNDGGGSIFRVTGSAPV